MGLCAKLEARSHLIKSICLTIQRLVLVELSLLIWYIFHFF